MTSELFSAVSFALDLHIDDVFTKPLVGESLQRVVEHMKTRRVGLVATCGGSESPEVEYAVQAPVYAIMKALSEMDAVAGCPD